MPLGRRRRAVAPLLVCLFALPALAQTAPRGAPPGSDDTLTTIAKEVQNPASPVVTIPIQSNIQNGLGAKGDQGFLFRLQPAIPFRITDRVYLISRTIIPIAHVPFSPRLDRESWEVGNVSQTAWLTTPVAGTNLLVGLGPSVTLPTLNSNAAGTRKTTLGPSALVVFQEKGNPWVFGSLMAQAWSVAGPPGRAVNVSTVQPFVNYNLGGGWFIASAPEITYDWEARGKKLTLPLGAGIGKALLFGKTPVTVAASAYYNAVRPSGVPEWVARLGVTFVLQ
jgi:hypothetical protein